MNSSPKDNMFIPKRAGSVLILVLIITACLTAVAFSLAYRCQIEIKLASASSKQVNLQYLAYGGIQRCLSLLAEEPLEPKRTLMAGHFFSSAEQEKLWKPDNQEAESISNVFYWITDEYGYLSINYSDPSCWEELGLLDDSQIAAIYDWIDTDDQASPGGAENDYYQRLEIPKKCKNAPIITLRELLDIKDISPENYSYPLATAIYSLPENASPVDFKDAIENKNESLLSYFSSYGNGKVNINTAGYKIIPVLPGLEESTAQALINFRAGSDRVIGTDDDNCIESSSGISQVESLTELEVELLGQYCCYNSDMFRIYSCAKDGENYLLLMATVKIVEDKPLVTNIERLL